MPQSLETQNILDTQRFIKGCKWLNDEDILFTL